MAIDESVNVLGSPLQPCSMDPVTGYFRNGCCDTSNNDHGSHTVCALMTDEFLEFSKRAGNDLTTPRMEFGFPGLSDGDQWCLCAGRFLQAYEHGAAPRVRLQSTHIRALDIVPMEYLTELACDLN